MFYSEFGPFVHCMCVYVCTVPGSGGRINSEIKKHCVLNPIELKPNSSTGFGIWISSHYNKHHPMVWI